jgi:UDP-3-O-[3-hydroxymyristoyl] glucosamine N-acyltransferase
MKISKSPSRLDWNTISSGAGIGGKVGVADGVYVGKGVLVGNGVKVEVGVFVGGEVSVGIGVFVEVGSSRAMITVGVVATGVSGAPMPQPNAAKQANEKNNNAYFFLIW